MTFRETITEYRDQSGELVGFAKVTRDLTERKLGEEALRRCEARFSAMVASVEPTVRVKPQEKIKLALDPRRLHFFDAQSEASI